MSQPHVRYLLIGAGQASDAAAHEIVQRNRGTDVLLVGQEINRPYPRVMLSRQFLRRQISRADIFATDSNWYGQHQIKLRTGRRLDHLDCTRHTAALDSGEEISFDILLLATGATAAPLAVDGAKLPNLFYLRTIEDAERLHHAVDQLRQIRHAGKPRAVVIGAGLLGVEVAASLLSLQLDVHLVCSRAQPWNRHAGEGAGKFLSRLLTNAGITIHAGQRVIKLEGDGRVQRVLTNAGEKIDCELAIAAVGINVPKDYLRNSPIAAERAMLVDAHCRTNMPDIFAAGDCAAVFDPLFGKHRLMDYGDMAAITGRIAGANMAGGNVVYDHLSHFDSEVLDTTITAWGESRWVDRYVYREAAVNKGSSFVEIGIDVGGRIAQVIRVGDCETAADLMALIKQRVNVAGREEMLKDSKAPLADFVGE